MSFGIGLAAALLLAAKAEDASAGTLGGVSTSFGLVAALSAILLLKAWQAHLIVGSLSTLAGVLALAAAAALLWRWCAPLGGARLAVAGSLSTTTGRASASQPKQLALPAGVDHHALVGELHHHFLTLQAAWDLGRSDDLQCLTTPEMLDEFRAARLAGIGSSKQTEVLNLNIELLAFEQLPEVQLVCVEFSGLSRESAMSVAGPFRELWMLIRAQDSPSAGWRLARHQALL